MQSRAEFRFPHPFGTDMPPLPHRMRQLGELICDCNLSESTDLGSNQDPQSMRPEPGPSQQETNSKKTNYQATDNALTSNEEDGS